MSQVKSFVFNPFQENTYILSDETKECIIIDPGCSNSSEQKELTDYIINNDLKPVKLLNTHCHIDHIMGNNYVSNKFKLGLECHKGDLQMLQKVMDIGKMYGVSVEASPEPVKFLEEGDSITFGNTLLSILFTPGHSPGSICFYNKEEKYIISGDVLFYESIGRSDLPGGHHDTLIKSIQEKLMVLDDSVEAYSGHGPKTTIGHERRNNPFLR